MTRALKHLLVASLILLPTAALAGISTYQPNPSDLSDLDHHSLLGAAGTAQIKLTQQSFTTTAVNYTFDFNQSQLNTLATYITNDGKIALGFDPDCHFFNNGVLFELTTSPVPEPGTVVLFAIAGVGLCIIGRLRALRVRK